MNKEMKNQYIQSLERECELLYQLLEISEEVSQQKAIRTTLIQLSKHLNKVDKVVNI